MYNISEVTVSASLAVVDSTAHGAIACADVCGGAAHWRLDRIGTCQHSVGFCDGHSDTVCGVSEVTVSAGQRA